MSRKMLKELSQELCRTRRRLLDEGSAEISELEIT